MQKDVIIDGRFNASLDWKEAAEKAREFASQGNKVLWNLNLGLFEDLLYPLDHLTQYKALGLSLEHFRNTLWRNFEPYSVGLCICTSQANFSKSYHWNETQRINWIGWLTDYTLFPCSSPVFGPLATA